MNRKIDTIIGLTFFGLIIIFVVTMALNEPFFNWAFERHKNQWSWYLRPLFLIPFCYFSYKRSLTGVFGILFCLLTSMFWFPKPDFVSANVVEFLAFEKQYLQSNWDTKKILISMLVPVSMSFLAMAFWKRNLLAGIGVIALIALGKIIWSVQNGGDSGMSIIIPAIMGLLICITLVYFGFKRLESKNKS